MTDGRRYRILGVLGKGGFGTVYRADLLGEGGFTRKVALKVLNADMDGVEDVARRLRDEARLLGILRHRAILGVDGLVRLNGRWTVVMEYIEGADLQRVARTQRVPLGPALEIVGEVASALHVAYTTPSSKGVPLKLLHRDIKPPNILLTKAGEIKVLDFGIARAEFSDREAQTRSVLYGSIGYMAPERLDFEELPEGDVYALGTVLYELLTSEPFGKASIRPDKHEKMVGENMERVGRICSPCPPGFLELLSSMLAYDPEDRPSSREVERRCRALRAEVDDPWLRDWAETVVPIARAEDQALEQDDFSGSVVVESTKSGLTVDGQPVVVTEDKSGLSQENGTTFVPANWGSEAKSPQQAPKSSRGGAGMVVGGVSVVGCLALTLGGVLLIGLIGIVAAWYSMQVEERPVNEVAGVSSGPSSTGPVELEVPDKPIPPGEEFGPPKGPSSRVQASLSRPWKTQKLPIDKGYVTYSDKTTLVVTYGAGPMAIMAERWEKAFVGLGWEKQYSVNSEQAFTRTFTHPDVKKDLAVSVVQSSGDVMVSCSMY